MNPSPETESGTPSSTPDAETTPGEYTRRQVIGLVLGPALFVIMLLIPAPAGMEVAAQKTAAVALLMATWWLCESIPIPATSVLPIPLFPLLAPIDLGLHQDPLLFLIPAALAASCAFMLPVATPPNAIVYASGYVSIPQMARSGFGLNLLSIVVIMAFAHTLIAKVFGVVPGVVPAWAGGM